MAGKASPKSLPIKSLTLLLDRIASSRSETRQRISTHSATAPTAFDVAATMQCLDLMRGAIRRKKARQSRPPIHPVRTTRAKQ